MKRKPVFKILKRLTVYLIAAAVLSISVASCGFQLNYNRNQLPAGASSISIGKIENSTFSPGAAIWLRKLLTEEFLKHSFYITAPDSADLTLSFQITDSGSSRKAYSYDGVRTTNEFLFTISGKLSVRNNIARTQHIDSLLISASHSIKTNAQELSPMKMEEGKHNALIDLRNKIFSSLTENF